MPRIPLILHSNNQSVEVVGLVDSGATISVLPYESGIQLGGVWDDRRAILRLAGNLSNQPAIPFFAIAEIAEFAPVRLAFAWVRSSNAPLILGQTNFFLEFDVCFYRSKLEFEVKPKQ
ncbi:MAG: hypothetical protein RMX68_012900 [Aulosira sp. ZfuVER01]|nr:hypothetical protein [Aulosira sp. ZfuVER01]MDZ8001044.1 hypothetical protein [Aulosira sp. DedVER01a]MDZ8056249.1 hypothetical protein [Aulosira sp. ZfuCHP01]